MRASLFILVCLLCHQMSASDLPKCLTPQAIKGTCINIERCSINKDGDLSTIKYVTYRVHSQCGFNGTTPLVCCPDGDILGQSDQVVQSATDFDCVTPNSTEGLCINLQRCPSIYELSTNTTAVTVEILKFLVQSQCGFNGTSPKVCCPKSDIIFETATTLQPGLKCSTPNATEGNCIHLQDCPAIYDIANDYNRPPTVETLNYLIQSQCGFNGTSPKVCCPVDDNQSLSNDLL